MSDKKKTKDYSKVYTTDEEIADMYAEIAEASSPETIRKAKIMKALTIAGRTVFVLFVAVVCLILIEVRIMRDQGDSPNILGYSVYNVLTGSMVPTLPVDSVFIAKRYQGQEVNVGDIVVFRSNTGERITHRIIEKGTDESGVTCYRTKGDNPQNSVDPYPLYEENIEAIFLMRLYLF